MRLRIIGNIVRPLDTITYLRPDALALAVVAAAGAGGAEEAAGVGLGGGVGVLSWGVGTRHD